MTRLLLLHPPLLAPMAWQPTADLLTAAGHEVTVPDLRGACQPADVLAELVPDAVQRRHLAECEPRLPRDFYEAERRARSHTRSWLPSTHD